MKYLGGEDKWVAQMRYQSCGKRRIWSASMKEVSTALEKADPDALQTVQTTAAAFGRLDSKMLQRCQDHGLKVHVIIADETDIVYTPSGWMLAEETLNNATVLGIKVATLQAGTDLASLQVIRDMKAKEDDKSVSVGFIDAYTKLADACDAEQGRTTQEKQKLEKERAAKEKLEKEKLEKERAAQEKLEKAEKDRLAKEKMVPAASAKSQAKKPLTS
jgi:uncharacterized membrane protein YukC